MRAVFYHIILFLTTTQPQMHVFRLFDGKMVEHWEVRDDLSMMQQLGVVPAHGQ